jgi:tetratricopeptide (TPR) repeat protein
LGVRRAGAAEIRDDDAELLAASREVAGHALTLNLLGRYLARAHKGDIRRRDQVKFEKADAKTQGGHAFRVMAAYERWLAQGGEEGARQLAVLRLLGLFDRPADAGCLAALRRPPAIAGLTEPLVGPGEDDWNLTLSTLADCRLVSTSPSPVPGEGRGEGTLDAHPLIREYFAKQLREQNLDAWRSAHRRLYEHLTESTERQPDTLEGLQPFYQAVAHGCQAGLTEEARTKVYRDRILRGRECYSTFKLGAIGADLGAIACFFEQPWTCIAPGVSDRGQAWLLSEAAFRLRALGRLGEALDPMRAGLDMAVRQEDWENAAIDASNLSELELMLGDVPAAVYHAEQSVVFADRSGDAFWRMTSRTTLADAQHQAGRRAEAPARFREAEAMQAEHQPKNPLLYSLRGFCYCDLLLAEAERAAWQSGAGRKPMCSHGQDARVTLISRCREIEERAAQSIQIAERNNWLLDIALDHLTLGRAALYRALLDKSHIPNPKSQIDPACRHLAAAVDGLRRAGQQDDTPRGLLSRAWLRSVQGDADGALADLDEAWQIAERGPMRLHLADILLYHARLFHSVKPYPWKSAKDDLALARKLIYECGYHRRDEELADAEAAADHW